MSESTNTGVYCCYTGRFFLNNTYLLKAQRLYVVSVFLVSLFLASWHLDDTRLLRVLCQVQE